jgi:hypothetical protein
MSRNEKLGSGSEIQIYSNPICNSTLQLSFLFTSGKPIITSVSDPDPDLIRSVDLDPGGQKLHTKIEKLRNFMF